MPKLSVVIITHNEEKRIRPTLESVKWCDEIIVVDSCSTDKTVDICQEYNHCQVYTQPFLGFGLQKRFAVEKATNDWILSVDADEVMTDALQKEIKTLMSKPTIPYSGFYLPITLVFMNRVFKYGSENKKLHLRLFNRNACNFNDKNLHETVEATGTTSKLENEILHYSYIDIEQYFHKFNNYTTAYAKDNLHKGKKTNVFAAVLKFKFYFFKLYFVRLNFLNGYPGVVWSLFSSFYILVKKAKLYEKNHSKSIS